VPHKEVLASKEYFFCITAHFEPDSTDSLQYAEMTIGLFMNGSSNDEA